MSERTDADKLAEKLLEDPSRDPDDNLCMLSRQLLRRREVISRLEKRLQELLDPTGDLINANRDTILRITEEGVQRLKKECTYIMNSLDQSDGPLPPIIIKDLRDRSRVAIQIIEAINSFHPMYGESWSGWPKSNKE